MTSNEASAEVVPSVERELRIIDRQNQPVAPLRTGLALPTAEAVARLRAKAEEHAEHAQAEATMKAYRSDWACFTDWCAAAGLESMPAAADTVILYITALNEEGRAVNTIRRRLATISRAHGEQGEPSPTAALPVKQVWKGIRRERKEDAPRKKAAARTVDVRAMVETIDQSRLIGVRDRAILVVGLAGAFRRSELVARNVDHVTEDGTGLLVRVGWSKADQDGSAPTPRTRGLPFGSDPATCPVRAYRDWLEASGITEGPIFRPIDRHGRMADTRLTGQSVARVVKRAARAAGYKPEDFAGHSLRRGCITSAAEAGAKDRDIMRHSGHRDPTILREYMEEATVWQDNVAMLIGL